MRYTRLVMACFVGVVLTAMVGRGQQVTAEEKAFIDKNVGKLVQVEPTAVTGEALEKVFGAGAKFYTVKVNMGGTSGAALLVAARVGDVLWDVSMPEAAAEMAGLKAAVKAGFKLKTEADGKAFEAALDVLYPPDTRYDEKRKAVRHAGAEWTFVRGVFINDFKGVVVTTDADGVITGIRYSREIKQ